MSTNAVAADEISLRMFQEALERARVRLGGNEHVAAYLGVGERAVRRWRAGTRVPRHREIGRMYARLLQA